jgi:RNA polymerase sigma-70 factor (ECF subfamily)
MAAHLAHDPADTDDVAQLARIKVLQHAGAFRGEAHATTWIRQIVRNTARDLGRWQGRRRAVSLERLPGAGLELPARNAASPLESLVARERDQEIRDAVAALPPKYREVVLLQDFGPAAGAGAAALLGLSLATLKCRRFRARRRLGIALGRPTA